jgi:hypothetical protein
MVTQGSGEVKARVPQVAREMERLEKAIVRMAEVRDAVEERLASILLPAAPFLGPEQTKDKQPPTVPLAQGLDGLTQQIYALTGSMENMLSRVEL